MAAGLRGTNVVSVWDLQSRKEIARLSGSGLGGPKVAFSPTSSILAYGGYFATGVSQHPVVCLWDPETRRNVTVLPLEPGCRALAFSSDGKTLLTSDFDSGLILWDVAESRKLARQEFRTAGNTGTPFAATRDLRLVAGSLDGEVYVFDRTAGKELWRAKASEDGVTALAFSSDGKILASGPGFASGTIKLWETGSGLELARLDGHRSWVSELIFDPEGHWLASSSADQTICLWNITDLAHVPPPRALRGHKLEVWRLALLPDGKTLVSGSKDGEVCVWSTVEDRRKRFEGVVAAKETQAWHFSSDGASILTVDTGNKVQEWKGEGFQEGADLVQLSPGITSFCFSQDGELLAAGFTNHQIQVWQMRRPPKLLCEFAMKKEVCLPVHFDNQNRRLAIFVVDSDRKLEIWDLASTPCSRILSKRLANSIIDAAGFTSDLSHFIQFDEADTMVSLLNLTNLDRITLGSGGPQCSSATISPDGRLVATGSWEGPVRIWDTTTKHQVTLHGLLTASSSVAFSPDGRRLAVGSDDKETVKIWEVGSWLELVTLAGHGSLFASIRFSPDGNSLGSVSEYGRLHFWRAPSREEVEAEDKADAEPRK